MTKRSLSIGVALLLCLGALLVGLWRLSATGISSEQRSVDAEPPPPPVVTARVEERILSDSVSVRGIVTASGSEVVMPPATDPSLPIVVEVRVVVGEVIKVGQVLAVVADRPVIATSLDIPLHRSINPGARGEDVRRLQVMLNTLDTSTRLQVDGEYGTATQEAVSRFYQQAGFEAPTNADELAPLLDSADDTVAVADKAVTDAQLLLKKLRATLDAASNGESDEKADKEAVDDAELSLGRARETLVSAKSDRAAVRRQSGVIADRTELASLGLPATVVAVNVAPGDLATGPLLEVTESMLVLESEVDIERATLFSLGGMAITEDGWELIIDSNTEFSDSGKVLVRFLPLNDLPLQSLGRSVRIDVELAATDGAVLAIPVSAIATVDGDTIVRLLDETGQENTAIIETGIPIGGWVEVLRSDPHLAVGDVVEVG